MSVDFEFYQPILVIRSITSNRAVRILDIINLNPHQSIEVFAAVGHQLPEASIIASLHKPYGDIYLGVAVDKTIEIVEIDLPSWHYNIVDRKAITAAINNVSPFAPTEIINTSSQAPPVAIKIIEYDFTLGPATAISKGYLTQEDWQRFNASVLLSNNQTPVIDYLSVGRPFAYDRERNKTLSVALINVSAGRKSPRASNLYLRTADGLSMTAAPFIMPWDATLISIAATSKSTASWQAEVHVNQTKFSTAGMSVINGRGNSEHSIDFARGSAIQIYLNGTNVAYPNVELAFARRFNN